MINKLFGMRIVDQVPALRRYARALTRDDTAADDLVHEALLRACERHRTFDGRGNMRGWLLSIVHNCFVDAARRAVSERRRADEAAALAPTHTSGAQESSARLTALAEAFAALPGEQRAVLHLVAIEGLSYAETADALGVPVGTVMSRLSRARSALREGERIPRSTPLHLRIVGGHDEPRD